MKKKIVLAILYGLANYCLLSAQTDSMFYFIDKTTLNNDVLMPISDSSLWVVNNGHNQQKIETKNIGKYIAKFSI